MTGHKDFNYPAFNKEADRFKNEGYIVLNPAVIRLPEGATWADYMRQALTMLCAADSIFMLKNWEGSRGARIEHKLAVDLEMEILYQ